MLPAIHQPDQEQIELLETIASNTARPALPRSVRWLLWAIIGLNVVQLIMLVIGGVILFVTLFTLGSQWAGPHGFYQEWINVWAYLLGYEAPYK